MIMHFSKRNPLWMIATGAVVGLLAHRLGFMSVV
jgi:hypothetical protein